MLAKLYVYYSKFEGGYDMEEKAARAYDLAALKYWGPSTHINFPVCFKSLKPKKKKKKEPSSFLISVIQKLKSLLHLIMFFWQLENYQTELEEMKNMSRQEYVAHLRR